MDNRTKEAIRYLGYGRQEVDEQTLGLVTDAFRELDETAKPRSIYRTFELQWKQTDTIRIEMMEIHSRNLSKNLKGCRQVVLLCGTLGIEVDYLIKRYSYTEMAKAVVMQACAAALLEEYLDERQEEIRTEMEKQDLYLRPRFSPGYGDFSILHQREILTLMEASKKIGLTMTESSMLTPTKSVTALIGLSTTQENCHQKGCEVCGKKDCIYRRES